jgi:hypothetical protein
MKMIRGKIKQIELEIKYNIFTEQKKLKAVQTVKELLDQIDFTVEVVPLEDIEKLSRLLVTLKGKPLNEEENRLIEKIVKTNHLM